ncbi:hypothetical protein [Oryza sativa Japonica Group]|uniref:Uncharacterized protein n=2 Tax=Oryza sativa subsp. japonica TaxID=39947 RepID=Q5QN67_ORYSJ|nr:hypothetical protein [Oryza sativa Japonica Group]BAD73258.1 hypothetical protein [Oryza sativa Japonica Group]
MGRKTHMRRWGQDDGREVGALSFSFSYSNKTGNLDSQNRGRSWLFRTPPRTRDGDGRPSRVVPEI